MLYFLFFLLFFCFLLFLGFVLCLFFWFLNLLSRILNNYKITFVNKTETNCATKHYFYSADMLKWYFYKIYNSILAVFFTFCFVIWLFENVKFFVPNIGWCLIFTNHCDSTRLIRWHKIHLFTFNFESQNNVRKIINKFWWSPVTTI